MNLYLAQIGIGARNVLHLSGPMMKMTMVFRTWSYFLLLLLVFFSLLLLNSVDLSHMLIIIVQCQNAIKIYTICLFKVLFHAKNCKWCEYHVHRITLSYLKIQLKLQFGRKRCEISNSLVKFPFTSNMNARNYHFYSADC